MNGRILIPGLLALFLGILYHWHANHHEVDCSPGFCQNPDISVPFLEQHEGNLLIRNLQDKPPQWQEASRNSIDEAGLYEVRLANADKNGLSQDTAMAFARLTFEAARKNEWFNYNKGLEDGFMLMENVDPLHYVNYSYMVDGETLNPQKPEALMYYPTQNGMKLAGVMFLANSLKDIPTQFQSPDINWHFHLATTPHCQKGVTSVCTLPDGSCPEGYNKSLITATMLHVWFVKHPGGPYATRMVLPNGVLDDTSSMASYQYAEKNRQEIYELQKELGNTRDPNNVTGSPIDH